MDDVAGSCGMRGVFAFLTAAAVFGTALSVPLSAEEKSGAAPQQALPPGTRVKDVTSSPVAAPSPTSAPTMQHSAPTPSPLPSPTSSSGSPSVNPSPSAPPDAGR